MLTALPGSLFLGPELGRIAELADQRGPDDDDVKHRVHRLVQISRIDLTVLSIVVVNMVLKPGA